jgi:putative peptidoglycan lipid II flippase
MDLLRGGKFHGADALETTHLFRIFSFSLALWAVQGIYARAFYAASDTKTPAIAGTIIVLLSFPFYGIFYRHFGMTGLAFASDFACSPPRLLRSLRHRLQRAGSLRSPPTAQTSLHSLLARLFGPRSRSLFYLSCARSFPRRLCAAKENGLHKSLSAALKLPSGAKAPILWTP